MAEVINHNKIAKNTIFLYIRQIVTMIISLATTGFVMRELGVEDYGIYNVVGGIVVLFSILQSSMSVGTQRFINYEMGKGDPNRVREVFNISIFIYYVIALIVLILSETIGLWYLSEKMVIPTTRMNAAHWVYQFSIITCMISIIQTPYTAVLIANEKMGVFGFFGVLESVVRFGLILILIVVDDIDKLILFGIINLFTGVFFRVLYQIYCKRNFPECKWQIPKDKNLFKEMMSFSGWSLLSRIAYVGRDQGGAIIVNSFFGVTMNASIAVASNVSAAVSSFVNNFQTAYRPQLVKAYAMNDIKEVFSLMFLSSKISSFLMLIFTIPLILNIDYILQLWLGVVPEKSGLLITILMIDSFVNALFAPFWMTIYAMGDIRNYQLMEGFVVILNVPLMLLAFTVGFSIEWIFIIRLFLVLVLFVYAVRYLKRVIQFPVKNYIKDIVVHIVLVGLISLVVVLLIIDNWSGVSKLVLSTIIYLFQLLPLFYYLVLSKEERLQLKKYFVKK